MMVRSDPTGSPGACPGAVDGSKVPTINMTDMDRMRTMARRKEDKRRTMVCDDVVEACAFISPPMILPVCYPHYFPTVRCVTEPAVCVLA